MICAVIKGPSIPDVHRQMAQAVATADLVELRIDHFSAFDLSALKTLRESFAIPMIFTLRSRQQGGCYQQQEEQRLSELALLSKLKPDYLDIECHVADEFVQEIVRLHPEIKIIISYHDFQKTAHDFDALYHNMQRRSGAFYKLAFHACSTLDALRLLCWLHARKHKNVITVSMGRHGQLTRILGPICGNPITYACLEDNQQTAPGQLTVTVLTETYGYRSLNPQTAIYGLIGDPVDKSISEITHNCLIQSCNLNAVYIKMQIAPEELEQFVLMAKQLPIHGLSVTMPLKEKILSFIDLADSQVKEVGACNTMHFQQNSIYGSNSDGAGALNAIERIMPVLNKRVILLGAGASAKAIAYEACKRGAYVTILNRHLNKAKDISECLNSEKGISLCLGKSLDRLKECAQEGYDILVNCTPVDLAIDHEFILPNAIVMDIRIKPKDTPFLQVAQFRGCKIIYGYQMFTEQAAIQWSRWTQNSIVPQLSLKILTQKAIASL